MFEDEDGAVTHMSFGELDEAANRAAAGLLELGAGRNDRVALHTGQRAESAVTHLAAYKIGAIIVTVSQLYGPDTVSHILADSGARVLVTDERIWAPLRHLRAKLPELREVVVAGDTPGAGEKPFEVLAADRGAPFVPALTSREDPALLIYTSGSTGLPKGILHAHRVLWAYNISTSLFYNLEMEEPGLVFWTPADWAWVGGLNDTVFPAWFHGHAVVASQHRFDAEWRSWRGMASRIAS